MIYILFSPSEGKNFGGENKELSLLGGVKAREEIVKNYQSIIFDNNEENIKKLFGFKKFEDCKDYICDIYNSPKLKAIQRYDGVAYDYLKYNDLTQNQQSYIDTHTIIFSNLFGPIKANDLIPVYKVKQGNSIGDIKPEEYYKKRFTYQLDLYLGDDEILDLRAGYYDKFYKIQKPYTTMKFLKNNKVVSHWAKAYRGIVLRNMAKNNIKTINELLKMEIENLIIKEIKQTSKKQEIVYEIIS
jgi:cytoplasmic iron level regulating protein YaaA (DUF328/UPF0246 family)